VLHAPSDGAAAEVGEPDAVRREHGQVAVGEEEQVASVVEDGGHVARYEILVLAKPDDRRRPLPNRDDLVRVERRDDGQSESAREAPHSLPHGVFERHARPRFARHAPAAVHVLLDQMRDDLRVRLG